ncbi:caspase family protein, partial [Thiotrichales bacterium HSG1]|nr:caspase family protein [Thiotrichales bacterium HSG1]
MRYLTIILFLLNLPAFADISVKTCNNLTEYPEILKQIKNSNELPTDILIDTFNNLINTSQSTNNSKINQYQTSITQIKTDVQKWRQNTLAKLQKCEKYWQYTIDKNLGKYYGLIIGINNYQYWPRLTTAVNDAKMIDTVLTNKYGFNNKLLINPSYQEIVTSFKHLKNKLGANDNLLIYYAGRSQRASDGQPYWLPSDAARDIYENWLETSVITSNLLITKDSIRNVLIISDSFYSNPLQASNIYSGNFTTEIKSTTTKQLLKQLPNYMLTDNKTELLKMALRKSRILIENNKNQPIIGNNRHSVVAQNILATLTGGETILTARNLIANMPRTLEYKVIDPNSTGDFVFKQPHKFIDA